MADSVPSGRDIIRQAFIHRGTPPGALDAMLASLASSTLRQYSRPLRSWWLFCRASTFSPFSPTPTQFLDFLARELERINSYSSLNNTRSAISLITNNDIGSHPLIKRFCKGVGALKPPRPRYEYVWDPAPVIDKLATFYPYDSLPLATITRKLVVLLALGTGQRVQTLAAIRVSQISLTDQLLIRIPERLKTSAPGRPQPFFSFSPFVDHDNLCLYRLMSHYLSVTQHLRAPSCDTLFVAYRKPHRAVGPQTISRWIRSCLAECGIQTDIFSAHSTRHASTSFAAQRGVPLDIIKRAAGWSGRSRVFAQFYNRPIVNPEQFSDSLLRRA